jgi:hypothetical protein
MMIIDYGAMERMKIGRGNRSSRIQFAPVPIRAHFQLVFHPKTSQKYYRRKASQGQTG